MPLSRENCEAMSVWPYIAQRVTALIMVPLVIGHLATMIFAVRNGLSAEEILGRTRGSIFWGGFYGLFVVAVSIHATIGLRTIAAEWLGGSPRLLNAGAVLLAVILLLLGGLAVAGVVLTW